MMIPINWTNYFFHADFTPCADVLGQLQTGQLIEGAVAVSMASALQQCDTRPTRTNWVASGPELDWNLDQAKVIYAGANSPQLATNSKFSHVVILEFAKGCTAPASKVYLQYNGTVGG